MKSLLKPGPALLRELYGLPEPIISVYFRMEDPAADDVAVRRRVIRHRLLRATTGRAALTAMENALSGIPRGPGTVAAFVGRDGAAHTFDMPGVDMADRVSRASVPDVVPFLKWRQYRLLAGSVAEMVDARLREAVADIAGSSGPGGLGLQGIPAVIDALAEGQVEELFIGPGADATAWFGPGPTDIAAHPAQLAVPDGDKRHGPMADVMIRAATLTDAETAVLPLETSEMLRDGVGAIRRPVG